MAEINYLGSAGRKLYNLTNVNRFRGDLLDGRINALNPSFAEIQMIESSSSWIHHGGTVVLARMGPKQSQFRTFAVDGNAAQFSVGTAA